MLKYLMASAMIAALAVPALAGGNGANSNAAPVAGLYSTLAPGGGVGEVLPGIVQRYTPSESPLNSQAPIDGLSYGQALRNSPARCAIWLDLLVWSLLSSARAD